MERYYSDNELDPHCEAILEEYDRYLPVYSKMAPELEEKLKGFFADAGIVVAAVEQRVKTRKSLAGKLALKGSKYNSIFDLTDIVGLRVITFYSDDVDKVASVIERLFEIDWENSVDKRKYHEIDSFGYLSLHYICRIPEEYYRDEEHPELNKIRFEVQMRTVLQHAWANMNHDIGYKSGLEVPKGYLRNLSRLAGMLELVDDEFSRIRIEIADYRRKVQSMVASGNLDEVLLDGDSFRTYIALDPFKRLNARIAAINQAEIHEVSMMNFLQVFKAFRFNTLGDIQKLIKDWSDAAYQIACYQMGITDIDIISSSLGPQNLCIAYILASGGGKAGIKLLFDALNGPQPGNAMMAELVVEQTKDLPFMNKHE
ncbi:MAG: hypothetical protein IKX03_03295 [Bacteroidales bacterium]|nr:hypothetical protein [Bacteroidales bacterium]MBR5056203.1 hypothetical protein [Bacteroidales bacterium]